MFVPVSHCKDTYNFDKTNNFFKKVKKKETKCLVSSVQNYQITLQLSQLWVYVTKCVLQHSHRLVRHQVALCASHRRYML